MAIAPVEMTFAPFGLTSEPLCKFNDVLVFRGERDAGTTQLIPAVGSGAAQQSAREPPACRRNVQFYILARPAVEDDAADDLPAMLDAEAGIGRVECCRGLVANELSDPIIRDNHETASPSS